MTEVNVTLASFLLDLEDEAGTYETKFKTGVRELDDRIQVWSGGRVLGVGRVESTSRSMGRKHENSTTETQNILLNLLTTHLLNVGQQETSFPHPNWSLRSQSTQQDGIEQEQQAQTQTQHPSIFIIAPPKSTIISDTYNLLLQAIQTSRSAYRETHLRNENTIQTAKAEDIALQILEQVNLLQYLDLTGLAESISEISSILSSTSSPKKRSAMKKIVLIEGLNSTISGALNRSSPSSVLARTAALVTGIFRSLRRLVQSSPEIVVLVELKVGVELARTDTRDRGEGLKSAFADRMGRSLRIGGSVGEILGGRRMVGGSLAPASGGGSSLVLERIVENALDGIVLVHDGFKDADDSSEGGKMIVEVIKDAMGDGLGSWAVWPGT